MYGVNKVFGEITNQKCMNPLLSHQYYNNDCFKCTDQLNVLINN